MPVCSIVADHKSEELYSKLSLAYSTEEERQIIEKAIEVCTPLCSTEPNIYGGSVTEGKRMITIEYHDVSDREDGQVYEAIIKYLGIEECR
ncbi:MAG: hypothetical protein JZU62_08450 [Sulfuricurvum sp.]|uniref:hypothetical protein n=1 Tax=Sulfuricurvum sp. TaxID=2025608 RepID=UPI0025F04FB9|nr:hypothetical protein [Sulfuricurvum sp.]MBV5321702.1 hypothetical protein [Sulfuricurvum sp.]